MEQKIDRKNIVNLTIKTILYIVFIWRGYMLLLGAISAFILWPIFLLPDSIFNIIDKLPFDIYCFVLIFSPFACYILAKLFGMFKFVDSLKINMLLKIMVIFLISFFSFLILFLKFNYFESFENTSLFSSSTIFALIPAFGLYKYFQYLTKKYPNPFEKIGYYSSIEYWKKLLKKTFFNLRCSNFDENR